jgi:protein involved in polysaccharide export with SLBB domain
MKTILSLWMLLMVAVVAAELKVGDELRLTLRGVPEEDAAEVSGDYIVNERGEVRLPLLDQGVRAAGATELQLSERLEAAYRAAGIYRKPRVEVAAAKAKQAGGAVVSVGGEVKHDGRVAFRDGMSVLEAIHAAGGRTEFGSRNVMLIRAGRQICLDFDQLAHKNIVLESNDALTVAQKGIIDRWKGTAEAVAPLLK